MNPVVKLGTSKLTKSRVLVCAPSNAALDEIVLRVLRKGLRDGAGNKVVPNIVRAGVAARMHSSIKTVTLEALVSQIVGEGAGSREVSLQHALLRPPDVIYINYVLERIQIKSIALESPVCSTLRDRSVWYRFDVRQL